MFVCLCVRHACLRVWKTIGMRFLVFLGRFYERMVLKKKIFEIPIFHPPTVGFSEKS